MNNNIQEDYCSFEVAKLLKEKGWFNNKSSLHRKLYSRYYNSKGELDGDITLDLKNKTPLLETPTHSLALKWLRENFKLHVKVDMILFNKWEYGVTDYNEPMKGFPNIAKNPTNPYVHEFNSYEEAVESALLYVLKELI